MTTDRLDADRRKLDEALGLFRTTAKLHPNSADEKLIAWAHGRGSDKPGAAMVRDAWHDYEQGRALAKLPTERFVIARERPAAAGSPPPERAPAAARAPEPRKPAAAKAPEPDEEILY